MSTLLVVSVPTHGRICEYNGWTVMVLNVFALINIQLDSHFIFVEKVV